MCLVFLWETATLQDVEEFVIKLIKTKNESRAYASKKTQNDADFFVKCPNLEN